MSLRQWTLVVVAALVPSWLTAWGGFTHQELSMRALEQLAETDEGARKVLSNHVYLAAFLGGSMAPDLSSDFLNDERDQNLRNLFHEHRFAESLIRNSLDDHDDLAAALGWMAHIVQDESAHGARGYAETKVTFTKKGLERLNHKVAEAVLDILAVTRQGAVRAPCLASPGRMVVAAYAMGVRLDFEKIKGHFGRFEESVNMAEVAFLAVGTRQKQGILPSAGAFYSDVEEGLDAGRGRASAVRETVEALRGRFDDFVTHEEKPYWSPDFVEISDDWQSTKGDLAALVVGGRRRSNLAMSILEKTGGVKRTAFVEFLRRLLSTKERDYESFVASFEKDY